jgi:hypothetical protein
MKFVADVHVTKRIITRLRAVGHEVEAIAEVNRRLSDRTILPKLKSECPQLSSGG